MIKHWVFLLAVVACGSKQDDASKADKDKPGKTEKPAPTAGKGSATKIDEADLFTGTAVTLPTPAAKLHFGMTEAEAKAAAPELFAKPYGYDVPGTDVNYSATKIVVQIEHGKVWNIRAQLTESQDAAKAWLTKKWGAPVEHKNSIGTPELFWSNTAGGMQAKLEQSASKSTLYFSQIMPRDQLLGSDPKHLGIEPAPFIGMSRDEAMKALAAYDPQPRKDDPDVIAVMFPPTETTFMGVGSSIDLRIKKDKVTGYTFGFVAGDAKDVDAFAAKLESMYGKGKYDGSLYTDYGKAAKAEIRKDTGFSSTLWVGDYRK